MNLLGLRTCCFLVLLLFRGEAKLEIGRSRRNFITWNDLKMDRHSRFYLRDVDIPDNRVIVVDKTGAGDSSTVQGAIDMVPENNGHRVKIHILPGIYREKVHIPASKPYISLIGEEEKASETVITWHDKASDKLTGDGGYLGTWNSASVTVQSDYFCASSITFQNTVISQGVIGYQAVALRIGGEKAMFYKVRFLGSQDTLLDEKGSHYFFQCFIQGTTDFIFGNARSLYQECEISVVDDGFAIAAQHRNSEVEDTGFSFMNCTVTGAGTGAVYLGRAWGNYSRIIYSYSEFDIDVRPDGWQDWRIPSRRNTVVFGEYKCRGRGADRSTRAEWSKALNYSEARHFLDTTFISGKQWLRL